MAYPILFRIGHFHLMVHEQDTSCDMIFKET